MPAGSLMFVHKKGIYTAQARALACILIRSGCSQSKLGGVVQKIGAAFGIYVPERMSGRTAQRAVLERKIAYDIQLGYELKKSPSFTVSGDATTDRHVNMEARFMIIHAPKRYGDPQDVSTTLVPKNRFLAVDSSVDHTSETQLHGWKAKLHNLTVTYSASPFARRNRNVLDVLECVVKLKGAGGDHAADQLKTVQLLITWKREMTCLLLARTFLGSGATPSPQMSELILRSTAASVDAVGGGGCWAIMTSQARMAVYVDHFNRAVEDLGKDLYEALPSEERRPLDLFLRLGCAMHKDLNSVKGGAAAMSTTWEELELTPPILLANKDNASTLRDIDPDALATASLASSEGLSPAELRALEASTRGAVKLVSLAGAIFNNKDDKKGQHDTYVYYFQHFLKRHGVRFPDTSNTRYQSYCAAAAELLVNREYYLSFLEFVRDRKQSPGLTNIEQNVYNGLQDPATLTELAVLALYAQAVTHPYMRVARIHQNGLKLGPLHEKLKAHVKRLIENPDLLLAPGATYKTGSLDGREWERPEVFTAIQQAASGLPHLRDILIGFLKGALRTWDRFTVEFAAGGAIDQASEAELDAAYILPTNDHNEGALGAYRVWRRSNPNGTLAYFNALKAFESSDTEDFMMTYLCHEEDEKHLRGAARAFDSSGHETKRRQQLIEHALAAAKEKAREREEKQRRDKEEKDRLRKVPLIFTKPALQEQLDVYKKVYGDPDVPPKSRIANKPEKLAALLEAIERNEPGKLDRSTD
ncbi:hypothetical protein OH76DRAFT_1452442 [Lentinus brumalis]|uniref:Uncharacterized protein n=1 Tax=Lentinus brumalis TaxID=2498619 RepID=A0A371DSD2_9APHY|nr:hypothetical protein OH76DRAFT_1452442 [Polyporus brumalis]